MQTLKFAKQDGQNYLFVPVDEKTQLHLQNLMQSENDNSIVKLFQVTAQAIIKKNFQMLIAMKSIEILVQMNKIKGCVLVEATEDMEKVIESFTKKVDELVTKTHGLLAEHEGVDENKTTLDALFGFAKRKSGSVGYNIENCKECRAKAECPLYQHEQKRKRRL